MIDTKITGLQEVDKKIRMMKKIIPDEATGGLFDVAIEIRNIALISMQNTVKRSDKVYKRGSVKHRPSAPGYPPAVDTGGLIGSIIPEIFPAQKEARVSSKITNPPYPFFLEDGTRKMAARPWMDPAIETMKDDIESGVMKRIIGGIERL